MESPKHLPSYSVIIIVVIFFLAAAAAVIAHMLSIVCAWLPSWAAHIFVGSLLGKFCGGSGGLPSYTLA